MFSFMSPKKGENDAVQAEQASNNETPPPAATGADAGSDKTPHPTAAASTVTTPTTTTNTTSPPRTRSWEEMHRQACIAHHTLVLSPNQVAKTAAAAATCSSSSSNDSTVQADAAANAVSDLITLPSRSATTGGNDPTLEATLVRLFQQQQAGGNVPLTSAASASAVQQTSFLYTAAATTASVLTSPIRGMQALKQYADRSASFRQDDDYYDDNQHDDLDDGSTFRQANDNTFVGSRSGAGATNATAASNQDAVVNANDSIFNVQLALECLQVMLAAVDKSEPRVLRLLPNENGTTTTASANATVVLPCDSYYWRGWLQSVFLRVDQQGEESNQQVPMMSQLVTQMPESQAALLLRCLVQASNGTVTVVHRRPDAADCVVLGKSESSSDHALTIRLTLFDLECAQNAVQARMDAANLKVTACSQRALVAKRTGHPKQALAEMKRRKLYEQSVENAFGELYNLERLQQALETTASQQETLNVLRDAGATLGSIRKQGTGSLEQVDDVLDDLHEELEHAATVSDTLAAPMANDVAFNEDELLNELMALSVDDNPKDKVKEEVKKEVVDDPMGQDTQTKSAQAKLLKDSTDDDKAQPALVPTLAS